MRVWEDGLFQKTKSNPVRLLAYNLLQISSQEFYVMTNVS